MTTLLEVRGVELRYLLTAYLFDHGPASVDELVDALAYQGFAVKGRPSKAVSDALRWERAHGRVFRRGRGRYRPASMPRSTEYRIARRVEALRARVAVLSLEGGQPVKPSGPVTAHVV
jgi:hypothetical protein